MSHSERLYLLGMKLDIQGVLLLMWSATVPLIHYSFPDDHHGNHSRAPLRTAYHAATALLAAACSAATLLPRLQGPHLGTARAALFAAFGAGSFVAPVAHGVLMCGLRAQGERIALPWIVATAVCNGVGAVAYTMKVSMLPLFFVPSLPFYYLSIPFSARDSWALTLRDVVSRKVVPEAI